MTDLSRVRKRPLEADAAANAGATGEIDIAACAMIAYSSEDPAHPVEHMLDGDTGPGATRWDQRRPDTRRAYRRGIRPAAGDLAARL
jgi:hypothetical protein